MTLELVLWGAAALAALACGALFRSAASVSVGLLSVVAAVARGSAGPARSGLDAGLGVAAAALAGIAAALVWRQAAALRFERRRAALLREELEASASEATSTIEASNLRFTTLARMSPIGFFETDADGTVVYVSQRWSEFLGVEPREARGRPWTVALRAEDRGTAEAHWREVDFELEFRPAAAAAHAEWVLCKIQPQYDESGSITGYVGAVTDVTDRKANEEERRQLELHIQKVQKLESLGLLAAGVAHDLNNILVGIVGNVDLLRSAIDEDSNLHRYVDRIERAASRTAAMVRHMQVFSGRAPGDFDSVDLDTLTRDITRMVGASLSAKLVLADPVAEGLPPVKGDPAQLSQVLLNLITNAAESYGEGGGEVRIAVGIDDPADESLRSMLDSRRKGGEYVYLEVCDDGAGIPHETAEKVFDPFFSTKLEGRGLGLAVVHGVVRSHRGAILLDSRPGKGTRVRALFPIATEPARATAADEPGAAPPTVLNSTEGWVLVVDDEDDVLETTRAMLEAAGQAVLTAGDERLALEMFREYAKEVRTVLCDVTMPHMSGETLMRELRSIREDVRVVMFSGFPVEEVQRRFSMEGVAGYLQKPFRRDQLLHMLQN